MLIVLLSKSELRRKQFQEINLIIILLSHHSIGIVVCINKDWEKTL